MPTTTQTLSPADRLKRDLEEAGIGFLVAPSGHVVSGHFAVKAQMIQRDRNTPGFLIINSIPTDAKLAVKSGVVSETLAKRVLSMEEAAQPAPAINSSVRAEQRAMVEEIKATPEMRLVEAVLTLMATRAATVDRTEIALAIRNAVAEIAASAVRGE